MDAISEANLYLSYEKQRYEAARQRPVLPVTIITGFLGAGKTTLLRKILRSKHNLRIAAIVNEFGSVDHDGGVVERDGQTDRVDKLIGGCVCCQGSLGSDLEDKVAELLRRPDHDRYDYLLIETSGVSDPESIIRSLDKSFGKLTRARLDSVVSVMDGDALLHQIGDEREIDIGIFPVALKRQLENADVIVINKADLLPHHKLSTLCEKVGAVNPSARVMICSYGQVPLHSVLDVEVPRTDVQGVSHERVSTHLHVSSDGGNLRKASPSSTHNHSSRISDSGGRMGNDNQKQKHHHSYDGNQCLADEGGGPGGHLRYDGLEQVTFTSSIPFFLARFQDWVCNDIPQGAVRVKGILAFNEDRLARCVFNMSGRRRLSIENDGKWDGPMKLYLVIIGVRIDRATVISALESLRVTESSHGSVPRGPQERELEEMRLLSELLRRDQLFDAVPGHAEPQCPPNVARFRFTGAGAYGIPPSQLCLKYGVDLDSVNMAILRAVNSGFIGNRVPSDEATAAVSNSDNTAGPTNVANPPTDADANISGEETPPRVFLTIQEGVHVSNGEGDDCLVLRYAVGGNVSLASSWAMVVGRAREVMKTELGHIHFCNCFS